MKRAVEVRDGGCDFFDCKCFHHACTYLHRACSKAVGEIQFVVINKYCVNV